MGNRLHSLPLPLLGGALAQGGGPVNSTALNAWLASPVFYIGFGLSLSIVALLVVIVAWRSERRRTRSGLNILSEAVTQLAEEGEYSAVGLGRNRELAALGEAFNRISLNLKSQTAELTRLQARLDTIQKYVDRFQRATESLAELNDEAPLQKALVEVLVDIFRFKRANLWLLHRFVKGREPVSPEGGAPSSDMDTQDILNRVGLLPACRSTELPGAPPAPAARLSHRGVLEVAMTNAEIVAPRISESILFDGIAPEFQKLGLTSYVAVPLFERGQLIGVIEVFDDEAPSELDAQLLRLFASRASSLISMLHSSEEMAQSREASELKNLELQMANRRLQRTNVRLEESDRLKSEFLANTSHELRTPLNSILGFTQLILADACDSDEEIKSNVQAIQESGERLLRLINEVLDLAKIEAGRMSLALSPVDVRPVIDAAMTLLKIQADAKGIELVVEGRGEHAPVRADHTKLYQILVNLLGNAVKFTEKGRICVRVISEQVPGFMTLEVEDTGIGISPDVLSRLFQNFVQGDGSVTRKFGGTGLGLSISQKMTDMQGGSLKLESAGEGKGSKATLMLPLWSNELEAAAQRPAEVAGQPKGPAGRTLVVIEDYLEFQQYLVDILEDRGWHVLTARTAREGLELIQEHTPAAIVLDMHLPWDEKDASVRSGYDIVGILGRDEELHDTPILIVTGMLRKTADRLLSQTVLNPLELYGKPLDEAAFFESLERLTSRERRLSRSASQSAPSV